MFAKFVIAPCHAKFCIIIKWWFSMYEIRNHIEKLPVWSKFIGCLLLNLLIAILDYLTGNISILLLYFFPIAIASWFIGGRAGFFISIVSCAELFIVNVLFSSPHLTMNVRFWNTFMVGSYFVIGGFLLSRVRAETDQARLKSITMEATNTELKCQPPRLFATPVANVIFQFNGQREFLS